MIYCPFCDGQGVIHQATIKRANQDIHICDECDTIWLTNEPITEENAKRFDSLMHQHNLQPLWSELTNIKRI